MDRNHLLYATLLMFICSFVFVTAYSNNSQKSLPVGYWKVIDSATGKPKSIVQTWKTNDNLIMGKVVNVLSENKFCTKCKGEEHNKPIVGMVVLSGLKAKDKQWTDGKLLNTANGKNYNCTVQILENGKRLHVRKYMGFPMLGSSQIWERVDLI